MGEPAANEPTMEEILASIREIIAEEGAGNADETVADRNSVDTMGQAGNAETAAIQEAMEEEMIQDQLQGDRRTSPVYHGDISPKQENKAAMDFRQVDLDEDMIERRTIAGPTAAKLRQEETERSRKAPEENEAERFRGALMSRTTDQAVHASFERLKSSFSESIDEKAEKMLKPMLQQWLDENLPTLVERLVREEIERAARGE